MSKGRVFPIAAPKKNKTCTHKDKLLRGIMLVKNIVEVIKKVVKRSKLNFRIMYKPCKESQVLELKKEAGIFWNDPLNSS